MKIKKIIKLEKNVNKKEGRKNNYNIKKEKVVN